MREVSQSQTAEIDWIRVSVCSEQRENDERGDKIICFSIDIEIEREHASVRYGNRFEISFEGTKSPIIDPRRARTKRTTKEYAGKARARRTEPPTTHTTPKRTFGGKRNAHNKEYPMSESETLKCALVSSQGTGGGGDGLGGDAGGGNGEGGGNGGGNGGGDGSDGDDMIDGSRALQRDVFSRALRQEREETVQPKRFRVKKKSRRNTKKKRTRDKRQ